MNCKYSFLKCNLLFCFILYPYLAGAEMQRGWCLLPLMSQEGAEIVTSYQVDYTGEFVAENLWVRVSEPGLGTARAIKAVLITKFGSREVDAREMDLFYYPETASYIGRLPGKLSIGPKIPSPLDFGRSHYQELEIRLNPATPGMPEIKLTDALNGTPRFKISLFHFHQDNRCGFWE